MLNLPMLKKWPFVLLLIGCMPIAASAQGYYWESGSQKKWLSYVTMEAGGGYRMFAGDIQQPNTLFNKLKPGYMGGIRYQPKPHIGFALQGGGRAYRGYREFAYPDSYEEMNGKMWRGQLVFQYNWLQWYDFNLRSFTSLDKANTFNSFLATGGGAGMYNASYQSNYIREMDTTTAVAYQGGASNGVAFFIPVVVGARLRITTKWHLGLEGQYDFFLTDQLDGADRGKRRDGMFSILLKFGFSFGQRTGRLDRR